jgi:hypothetical protein
VLAVKRGATRACYVDPRVVVLKVLLVAVAVVVALVIGFFAYVLFLNVRFNRRNPHAHAAATLRKRVDAQAGAGAYDDAVCTYRDLRDLASIHAVEPELVRYLMEAAETIARAAGDRRDVAVAAELYDDVQNVTHVRVMPVLRELVRALLPHDRGKALVCVELLSRLSETYPKQTWLYLVAANRFGRS